MAYRFLTAIFALILLLNLPGTALSADYAESVKKAAEGLIIATPDDPVITIWGIPFPKKFDHLIRGKVVDYRKKDPGGGQSVSYSGGGMAVNIYVYSGGLDAIPDGPLSDEVKKEFGQSLLGIEKHPFFKNVKVLDRYGMGDLSQHLLFLAADISFTNAKGAPLISNLFVGSYRNQFIKVRFTLPDVKNEENEAGVGRRFLMRFASGVWPELNWNQKK